MQITHSFTGETGTGRNTKPGTIKTIKTPTSKAAFAWEFLRRNSEYQADYERLAAMAEQHDVIGRYGRAHGLNANSCWPEAATQNETDYEIDIELSSSAELPKSLPFHADLYRTLTKWGLDNLLPDPCHNLHDMPELKNLFRAGCNVYQTEQSFEDSGEVIPYDGGIVFTDTQCLMLFDIALPIEGQLLQIKKQLEIMQRNANNGKLIIASKHEEKYFLLYLRILDADACGATDMEIRKVLYSHKSATKMAPASNYSPRNGNLHQNRKSALELRNGAYKNLINE